MLAHREAGARLLGRGRDGRQLAERKALERLEPLAAGAGAAQVDHAVLELVAEDDGAVADGVGAAGDAGLEFAGRDLGAERQRGLQRGAAGDLDVGAGRVGRKARIEQRLAGEVEVAAVRDHRAGHDFADALALEVELVGEAAERGRQHREVALVGVAGMAAAEGDAGRADDRDFPEFGHGAPKPSRPRGP